MALLITSETYRDELMEADPSRMVVMCYDEILTALHMSVEAIERGNIEERFNSVAVATELLTTLHLCLDMENGGKIAENLGRIYEYIVKNLPRVNLFNDPEPALQAVELLEPLRESWLELDNRGNTDDTTVAVDNVAFERTRAGRSTANEHGIA